MDKDNKAKNKVIQTYAEDMAHVIQDDKGGLIKKIIQGEREHEIIKRNLSPESRRNKTFMLIGLLFILLSSATLFYFFFGREVPTVPLEQQFTPIIFNDKSTFIEVKDFKKDEIIQTVKNEVERTEVKNTGVEGIYLTENKKVFGLRRFISLIKANFMPGDNTLFVSDNFLLGISNNTTKDFFIILKVRSTTDIFGSLRSWEDKMFSDLHEFFGVGISSETKYLLTANFVDDIIENKNARILYDKDGKVVMMYIFADENSVIITGTNKAAQEIMLRLASSRVKK